MTGILLQLSVESERGDSSKLPCPIDVRMKMNLSWQNSYFRFSHIKFSCWCSALKHGPLFRRLVRGPPVMLRPRPRCDSHGDQALGKSGGVVWSLGSPATCYLGGGNCCEWAGKSRHRGFTGSTGQYFLSVWIINLCQQVNQSEISFEIREEDVGGPKRRSNEGLASSKEKAMRVEPEPMAAVFFDVEQEEEEVMPTTMKVKCWNPEIFLRCQVIIFTDPQLTTILTVVNLFEGENRGKGGEEAG